MSVLKSRKIVIILSEEPIKIKISLKILHLKKGVN